MCLFCVFLINHSFLCPHLPALTNKRGGDHGLILRGNPLLGDLLPLREELHSSIPSDITARKTALVHTSEREGFPRYRHPDINPQHGTRETFQKVLTVLTHRSIDTGRVTIRNRVLNSDSFIKGVYPQHTQNWTKNLLPTSSVLTGLVLNNSGTHPIPLRFVTGPLPPIHQNLRSVPGLCVTDVTQDLVLTELVDYGSNFPRLLPRFESRRFLH